MLLTSIGLFLFLAGFVIGLGAVTVIDVHGALGMRSSYWTQTTIRTHKVTKPLIWVGIFLAIVGGTIFYRNEGLTVLPMAHALLALILILNGLFLSFWVSPQLLEREKKAMDKEILPKKLQNKILVSLVISDVGWWGSLALLTYYLVY